MHTGKQLHYAAIVIFPCPSSHSPDAVTSVCQCTLFIVQTYHDYSLTIPKDRGITTSVEETLLNVLGTWGVCIGWDGRQGDIVACFASGSK